MTGAEFRIFRLIARLTQTEAALELGCHRATVARWEADQTRIPYLAERRITEIATRVQNA